MVTPKVLGEHLVVDVTIESATLRKRQTQNNETVDEWALRLTIPQLGIKQYSTPTTMPAAWAPKLFAGETHRAKVSRGRLKDDKTGLHDSEYWWDIVEWDTQALASPQAAQAAVPGAQDDYRRSKYEMRWTEALHLATTLQAGQTSIGLQSPYTMPDYRSSILGMAQWYYGLLEAGPPANIPPDGATIDVQPPDEPEAAEAPARTNPALCTKPRHNKAPLQKVPGDPRPRHPVTTTVDGLKIITWCYGS